MRSCHELLTLVGFTHASSVIPVVSWSAGAFGMFTRPPVNDSAPPNLPAAVRATPLPNDPVFPFVDASITLDPVVSSNAYAATSPATCVFDTVTDTPADVVV